MLEIQQIAGLTWHVNHFKSQQAVLYMKKIN